MIQSTRVPALLKKFVDGIVKANGAAQHLVHQHEDIRFAPIYRKLSAIRDKTLKIAISATGEVKNGKHR